MVFSAHCKQLLLAKKRQFIYIDYKFKRNKKSKMNLISIAIGGIFLCFGIACIFLKAVSVEYIDTQGILHENFFLLPVGFLCLFCGFITFLTIGIRNIFCRIKRNFVLRYRKAVTPNKSQPYYVKSFFLIRSIHFQFINSDCIIGSLSRFSMVAPSCTQNFFAL